MLNIRPLSDGLKKLAREELNEVESRIPEDVEKLRSWIAKQAHLKARDDDQFLVSFLRGCKYSLEKAKSKIDYFYTIRTIMPEVFKDRKVDESALDICRSGACVRLPTPLGTDGPCINLFSLPRLDQNKYCLRDLFRYYMRVVDINILEDDNNIVSGYVEVIDLSKMTVSFMTKFEVMLAKKIIIFAEKASPMRLKGMHFVCCPREILPIFYLIRSLMSEKIKQRFFIHKNFDELYEHIPKENLPIEYGGTNGSIPDLQVEAEKNLMKFNNYFIDDDNYRVNDKLRVGRKVDGETFFGIEGSFRKLEID